MAKTRTIRVNSRNYEAVRIYSSGISPQYAVTPKNDQPAKTELITEDFVNEHPEYAPILEACRMAFNDRTTFDKRVGGFKTRI